MFLLQRHLPGGRFAPLLFVVVVMVLWAIAPTAQARSIKVGVDYEATDFCRTAPDVVRSKLQFTAKIVRKGVPKPNNVRVTYKILDTTHSLNLRTGVVNLRKNKRFKAKTRFFSAQAGADLAYRLGISYSVHGRKFTKKTNITYHVPSVPEMDTLGVPACS
jgi:hypothetical protein